MDIIYTTLGIAMIVLAIVAAVVMIRQRFTMARLRRTRIATEAGVLSPPEFAALETFYAKQLPHDVTWLYEQPELINRRHMELRSSIDNEVYLIDYFLPATVQSVTNTWFDVGKDRFPFAIDEAGNYYVVRLATPETSQVLYVDHEQSSAWPVASSLRTFIAGLVG